jgi:adenylosuccinate synthase
VTGATKIVAISGPVGAGKSTFASNLALFLPGVVVSTRTILEAELPDARRTRTRLQSDGRRLDQDTNGRWVANAVVARMASKPPWVIVDAVRIAPQVHALRNLAPTLHVHLFAAREVMAKRYENKYQWEAEPPYSIVEADPTEMQVDSLRRIADIVFETEELSPNDIPKEMLDALNALTRLS